MPDMVNIILERQAELEEERWERHHAERRYESLFDGYLYDDDCVYYDSDDDPYYHY